MTLRLPILLLGLLGLAGCNISPVPSPPAEQPDLDGDGLGLTGPESIDMDIVSFDADPGTVDPPEGVVVVTNLSTDDAPSVVAVREDGSFSIGLSALPTHRIRFQVVAETRSEPVDFEIDATLSGGTIVQPVLTCLTLDPSAWVGLDGGDDARSIVVRNDCEEAVNLAPPLLRRGQGGFSFTPTGSSTLEPGEVGFVTVRSNGDAPEVEDVLFLDVSGPAVERRAITISVP